MTSKMTKPAVVFIGAMTCCALWGGAFPGIKIGYELFSITASDRGGQMMFAGYRFILAGILAWIIGSVIYKKPLFPKRSSIGKICILGLLQTFLQYFFFYLGLANTTGVKASIIEGLNVFFAMLVAAGIFGMEKLSRKKILGCLIGFAGVVLVNFSGSGMQLSFTLLGEGAILISTIAYAFSSVCIKKFSQEEEPFVLSSYQFVAGGLLLLVIGKFMRDAEVVFQDNQNSVADHVVRKSIVSILINHPSYLGILLLLAGISAIAYSMWGVLLKYNEVSKVAVYGFMTPVFGVMLSAIFLHETSNRNIYQVIVALLLVSIGTWMVQTKEKVQ